MLHVVIVLFLQRLIFAVIDRLVSSIIVTICNCTVLDVAIESRPFFEDGPVAGSSDVDSVKGKIKNRGL